MTNTETKHNTEYLTVGTRVSVCIGSDQYAATVVKSTKRTATIKYDGRHNDEELTFRLTTADARYYTHRQHHYLLLDGGHTKLDPSF